MFQVWISADGQAWQAHSEPDDHYWHAARQARSQPAWALVSRVDWDHNVIVVFAAGTPVEHPLKGSNLEIGEQP